MANTNIFKGLLVVLVILSLFGPLLTSETFAQSSATRQQIEDMAKDSPIKTPGDVTNVLKGILRWTYLIFFILAVYFILMAGFSYLTAGGNPEKIKTATSSLLWAFVAIAVGLISVGAASIITSFITPP